MSFGQSNQSVHFIFYHNKNKTKHPLTINHSAFFILLNLNMQNHQRHIIHCPHNIPETHSSAITPQSHQYLYALTTISFVSFILLPSPLSFHMTSSSFSPAITYKLQYFTQSSLPLLYATIISFSALLLFTTATLACVAISLRNMLRFCVNLFLFFVNRFLSIPSIKLSNHWSIIDCLSTGCIRITFCRNCRKKSSYNRIRPNSGRDIVYGL